MTKAAQKIEAQGHTQLFRIGRVYNSHGVSDYYHHTDENSGEYFSGIKVAAAFKTYSDAWNKAAVLKERVPCIIGGTSISYEVEDFAKATGGK